MSKERALEIKCRAWDLEKKVMIYDGSQESWLHDLYNMRVGSLVHNTVWRIGKYYGTLMLFTGLKDIHSEDLYEGDILSSPFSNPYEIIFRNGQFLASLPEGKIENRGNYLTTILCGKYGKKLGNIYQSPELLQTGEK